MSLGDPMINRRPGTVSSGGIKFIYWKVCPETVFLNKIPLDGRNIVIFLKYTGFIRSVTMRLLPSWCEIIM